MRGSDTEVTAAEARDAAVADTVGAASDPPLAWPGIAWMSTRSVIRVDYGRVRVLDLERLRNFDEACQAGG